MNILLQAIKLAPRLLWQSLFQPSKAYEFAHESEKNGYILILSSFLWGLGLGIVLAIPHYLLYHDVVGSVSFLFAVALVIAFAVAFTSASANVDAFKVEEAFILMFVFTVLFTLALALIGVIGAFKSAVIEVFFLFTYLLFYFIPIILAFCGMLCFFISPDKIQASVMIFTLTSLIGIFAGVGSIIKINSYV